ncbi:MAG: alpha/beta fold hydrolase [Chakrabartia sp.]
MTVADPLPRIAYFHGLPGGAGEWQCCAPPDLFAFAPDRNAATNPAALARRVLDNCHHENLILIGFSLGAPIALAVARELGERVAQIHLISPAAPLHLGHFLDDMAGGGLFRLARSSPTLFKMVARFESLLARTMPFFLLDRLFASAVGEDRALRCDPAFRQAMAAILREGLGRDPSGFVAEVRAYVSDWRDDLSRARAPVTIWQGDLDSWTPPSMAEALATALPGPVTLHRLPGCAHYSTLYAALGKVQQATF